MTMLVGAGGMARGAPRHPSHTRTWAAASVAMARPRWGATRHDSEGGAARGNVGLRCTRTHGGWRGHDHDHGRLGAAVKKAQRGSGLSEAEEAQHGSDANEAEHGVVEEALLERRRGLESVPRVVDRVQVR